MVDRPEFPMMAAKVFSEENWKIQFARLSSELLAGQSLFRKLFDLDENYENTKSAYIIPDDPVLSLSLNFSETPRGNFLRVYSMYLCNDTVFRNDY